MICKPWIGLALLLLSSSVAPAIAEEPWPAPLPTLDLTTAKRTEVVEWMEAVLQDHASFTLALTDLGATYSQTVDSLALYPGGLYLSIRESSSDGGTSSEIVSTIALPHQQTSSAWSFLRDIPMDTFAREQFSYTGTVALTAPTPPATLLEGTVPSFYLLQVNPMPAPHFEIAITDSSGERTVQTTPGIELRFLSVDGRDAFKRGLDRLDAIDANPYSLDADGPVAELTTVEQLCGALSGEITYAAELGWTIAGDSSGLFESWEQHLFECDIEHLMLQSRYVAFQGEKESLYADSTVRWDDLDFIRMTVALMPLPMAINGPNDTRTFALTHPVDWAKTQTGQPVVYRIRIPTRGDEPLVQYHTEFLLGDALEGALEDMTRSHIDIICREERNAESIKNKLLALAKLTKG